MAYFFSVSLIGLLLSEYETNMYLNMSAEISTGEKNKHTALTDYIYFCICKYYL